MNAVDGITLTAGILALTFCPIGLIFGLVGGISALRARRSQSWPEVMGTIIQSGVNRIPDSEGPDTYSIAATYEYSVAGRNYQSQRLKFGPTASSSGQARMLSQAQARYPVGQQVPVYYNPDNPADAVLDRGGTLSWLFLGIGIVGSCLGLASLVVAGYLYLR